MDLLRNLLSLYAECQLRADQHLRGPPRAGAGAEGRGVGRGSLVARGPFRAPHGAAALGDPAARIPPHSAPDAALCRARTF